MDRENPIYFAIGDVHGESGKLDEMHAAILERLAWEKKQPGFDGARIVHLGDYVDRGRDSRGVIDAVMRFEARFAGDPDIQVISLMGNHEQMMLDWIDGDDPPRAGWLEQGGRETLESYGWSDGEDWRAYVPQIHVDWLRKLPFTVVDDDRNLVFVHAGIEPALHPNNRPHALLWTRSASFFDDAKWPDRPELAGLRVIHGHTPTQEPELTMHRINVDTGAVFGGPLTAVMLKPGAEPMFIRAN